MTCAKVKVRCTIVAVDGEVFQGENRCRNPQNICPRLPGEGYSKCKMICDQVGHAEIVALSLAGEKARNAVALIEKHRRLCDPCAKAMLAAGIRQVVFAENSAIQP